MTIRKFTATLALFTLVFSSCQPIFADTDKKRQEALNELALYLSDKSVKLDDKEEELNKKEVGLEELSRKIHDKDVAMTVREIELDDLKETLNKGSVYLAAGNKELERDQQLLAKRKEEVERVAKDADDKLKRADERFASAEDKLTEAHQLEKIVADRQKDIDTKLVQISLEQAALIAKRDELSNDFDAKTAQLELDRKKLDGEKELYASKQKELEQIIGTLNAMTNERDSAMKEVSDLKAEALENAKKLDKLLSMTEAQKATIAQLKNAIDLKEQEIKAFYSPNISVTVMSDKGSINWSDGSIQAKGHGVPPENVTPSQGKLLAKRAAILDLQRNMLETIKGVQIDSKTKMNKFIVEEDSVSSAVNGTISGVTIISDDWDEDEKIYTVTGQIKQNELAQVMSEISKRLPRATNKPKTEGKKDGARYTGLIVDVKHLIVGQQKFFRIVDEKGKLVYGNDYADRNIQARIGLCAYYENRVFTSDEQARVGDNPIFIKAQRISSNGEDIVITMHDAEIIRHNRIDFRNQCKVIIVRS